MRKIKFRAWDKMSKEMINDILYLENQEHNNFGNVLKDKSKVVMQYTGLLDKNGKEIYEGDIVKWDDDSNEEYWRVATVNINPDIYFEIIKNNKHELSAEEGRKFHFSNFIYTDTEKHLEIIGNIYENKELIK